MVQARYQYAIDVMLTRLRMIDADLTEKNERPLIRNLCSRIKTAESIVKKLERKEREVTFETAVNTLNADAVRRQKDFTIVKEKNYIRKPKKSGYQSLHLIVEVPVTYLDKTTAVRVEIQIRSVAMDYWAELDSQMCYKKDAGQLEAVEKATKQYADVIAGVDKKMLELRKKIQKM